MKPTHVFDLSRRNFMLALAALPPAQKLLAAGDAPSAHGFENSLLQAGVAGTDECLWTYRIRSSGWEYRIGPPVFNIDGARVVAALKNVEPTREPARLINGATEHTYRGTFAEHADLALELRFRVGEGSPIVRFQYLLESKTARRLTKPAGSDDLTYLSLSLNRLAQIKEVRLSNFVELWHSFSVEEVTISPRDYEQEFAVMGPILVASDGVHSLLLAYEHGSQVPDAFLRYVLQPDRGLKLQAAKSNYLTAQTLDAAHGYETVWFETGAMNSGEDALASAFRNFVRQDMTQNLASRRPLIYYNTWNFQERNRWWNGKPFLDSMNETRLLSEIDAAHRMGIEVYVIDAGWYTHRGDWAVTPERFPNRLKNLKARLDEYGMKLGLWFAPTSAGINSQAYLDNKDCAMTWKGKAREPVVEWEGEANCSMCLVSRYGEVFEEQVLRLAKDPGVTLFKWDGVEQYACDSPHHLHGNETHSPQERADSYAFQLVHQMCRIADKLAKACPEATVDFDITERYRTVGLAFLSSGRYFLMNNGPYYHSYDIPGHYKDSNWNLLFYKGPARTWMCRAPLGFDRWIPSNLFLTHYYPDDPLASQEVNMASLLLGQNGIWGDLPGVSDAGVQYIAGVMARYKKVRDDIMESDPVVTGVVSGSPEIHEKISARSGKGVVAVFASAAGRYAYVTRNRVAAPHGASGDVSVKIDHEGRARLDFDFAKPGAKLLFFGA